MLYKNDEQYKLTADDIKVIKKKFPKFPIRLVYPAERVKPSTSKHNRLPDKPNSVSFPFLTMVKSGTGTDVWRYAENKLIGQGGKLIYLPHNFNFTGTFILNEHDMELVWWLYTKCPYLAGGANYNGRPAKCVFEDLAGDAERRAQMEEKVADVKALLYSKHMGLPEEKLRRIAKAYFVPDVDELTLAQIKLALEIQIKREPKDGYEKFLELASADQYLEIRAALQDAIDKKVIKYIVNKREWAWVNEQGRKVEAIATVNVSADPNEALMDFYLGNKKFSEELHSALRGERVVLSKGKNSPTEVDVTE